MSLKIDVLIQKIILGEKIINTPKKNEIIDFKDNFLLKITKRIIFQSKIIKPKTISKSEIKTRRKPKRKNI